MKRIASIVLTDTFKLMQCITHIPVKVFELCMYYTRILMYEKLQLTKLNYLHGSPSRFNYITQYIKMTRIARVNSMDTFRLIQCITRIVIEIFRLCVYYTRTLMYEKL